MLVVLQAFGQHNKGFKYLGYVAKREAMTENSKQGTLACKPADDPESPFDVDENEDRETSESVDRPADIHTLADYGSDGQSTLASLEGGD